MDRGLRGASFPGRVSDFIMLPEFPNKRVRMLAEHHAVFGTGQS